MLWFVCSALLLSWEGFRGFCENAMASLVSLSLLNFVVITFACVHAFQLLTYIVPILYVWCCPMPNLKNKYNSSWALVTGGSSGIGKALCTELAKQNLNIVIAALEDELLSATIEELKQAHPHQFFRSVGVDLSPGKDYMKKIIDATKDIDIGIVFNNAGYIATGFFQDSSVERQMANLECNVVSGVQITHHFMQLMTKGGCIVYTSSASAYMPSPFACMYGGTKAFLSQFAACLAVESKYRGIDVLAVHPSPVATRFYDKTHKLDALDFAKLFACAPDALPKEIIKSIGRVYWRDIGGFALCARLIINVASYNFWVTLFATFAHHMPDFQRYSKKKA